MLIRYEPLPLLKRKSNSNLHIQILMIAGVKIFDGEKFNVSIRVFFSSTEI